MKTLAIVLLLATPAAAQQLPTPGERKAADIASWTTAITAIALDTHATWRKSCSGGQWDPCEGAIVRAGLRVGITYGAAFLVKKAVHRMRPCAPTHSCGIDDEASSFYSAHTAIAFSTIGGPRLSIALPLAIGTGGLRVGAGKHWVTDVLAGAAAGALVSRIR